MDNDSSTQTLSYVLGQLSGGENSRLETRLQADPHAVAEVKQCADSVTGFALEVSGIHSVNEFEKERIFGDILAASAPGRAATLKLAWRRWVWPAAAAVLLIFNLLELGKIHQLKEPPALPGHVITVGSNASGPGLAENARIGVDVQQVDHVLGRLEDEQKKINELRNEYIALLAAKNATSKDYQKMLERFAAQMSALASGGRLSAIELLDSVTYAAGGSKAAGGQSSPLLTNPGITAATPPVKSNSSQPAGTSPESSLDPTGTGSTATDPSSLAATQAPSSTGTTTLTATTASAGITTSTGSPSPTASTATNGTSGISSITTEGNPTTLAPPTGTAPSSSTSSPSATATDPAPSSAGPSSSAPTESNNTGTTASPASAYSVFDSSAKQGFLDMYNMPTVGSDQVLELWVQPIGSDAYVPVGVIPSQYYGGSGGIYYKLPDDSAIPSKILITVEANTGTPAAPSNTVVVRGP